VNKQSLLLVALCAATLATPALAARIHLANTDSTCHGEVTVNSFEPDDKVRMVPTRQVKLKNGESKPIKCNHDKRCYLAWNDNVGSSWHSDTVSKNNNSSNNPYILKCVDK